MSNRNRELRYLLGYAAFREWRWHAHRAQVLKDRQPKKPAPPVGFFGWAFFGIFMCGLSIPYYMTVDGTGILPFFIFLNIVWNIVSVAIMAAGIRESLARG